MKFMYEILSEVPPNQNPGAATVSYESLESLLICAVSEIKPRFIQIIESSEF